MCFQEVPQPLEIGPLSLHLSRMGSLLLQKPFDLLDAPAHPFETLFCLLETCASGGKAFVGFRLETLQAIVNHL